MAKNYAEFDRRTNYRELPLNPPKIEVKQTGNAIVKDYSRAISYEDKVKDKNGTDISFRVINHSSQFSFIRWNNIYFDNDYVGGDLNYYFGEGIQNHCFTPKGSFAKEISLVFLIPIIGIKNRKKPLSYLENHFFKYLAYAN